MPSKFSKIILSMLLCLVVSGSLLEAGDRSKISKKTWQEVTPYLLPDDHPIKPGLDKIFSASRATINEKTMRKAGFINAKARKFSHVVVTTHPELPGYVLKVYLDAQRYFKDKKEHHHWINRIKGARAIQAMLDEHQWNHLCKAPKKWIYALPDTPKHPKDLRAKHFILVEEDLDVLSTEDNRAAWKSDLVTTEKLDALYAILDGVGLHDCSKIHNIPFSTDGRIAFIDTESFNDWPVDYHLLNGDLSSDMREYWEELTK